MNKTLISLITILCTTLALLSCKKDKEEEKPSPKQLLTARPWKLNKVIAQGIDLTNDPRAQEAIAAFNNSTFVFKSDGTYTATDNTSGDATSGTWELQENDTKLFIKSGDESYTFTVKELTQNTLYLTIPFTLPPPFSITVPAELQMIPA